jgi:hypothetical protein
VPIAARAHAGPEAGRRQFDRGPTHRLGDHGRDVALHLEDIIDVVGEALMRMAVLSEEARGQSRRRHMLRARQQRASAAPKQGFAADRDRVEIGAVKSIPHGQGLVSPRCIAGELQCHADCS